jgi:amino acid adenylation domain-containing protein
VPVDFETVDAATETWDTLHDRLIAAARRPFDLECGPVMRVRLFRRSTRDHVLLITLHHIAVDFWSVGVVLQDLRELYAMRRSGKGAALVPSDVTYGDFVCWQTALLAGAEGERLWAYWQKRLAGELPVLNVPTDRPRPALPTYRGASQALSLSEPLTRELDGLAQHEGVTRYMVLLTAFQILLHRYSGQNDILVGCPIALRKKPQFRHIVGYCVNPVVMRGQVSGDLTGRAFLQQMRQTVLEALEHADYPFPLLVERLQPRRDASHTPLFQACMVLQTLAPQDDLLALFVPSAGAPRQLAFGDLVLEPYPLPQQEGQFDLTLAMAEMGSRLYGLLHYNTDLYDASTAARMAQHFQIVLQGLVAQPDRPLHALPLLTPAERQQILLAWNVTETPYPRDLCVHQVFEDQAARTPAAVAVACEDACLTYEALNRRANQLAHLLRARQVGPDTLVGICIERSLDMVVSVLAILKAGGAYVPLELTYPRERLAFIVADTHMPLLLTQSRLLDRLPDTAATIVCVDAIGADLAPTPTANLMSAASADQLAYVMYTSGSTGRPKGIAIPHRGVVRLVKNPNFATLTADDVMCQVLPVAFDAATLEMWSALLNGGRLALPPPGPLSLDILERLITTHRVTTLVLTTGLFHVMVDECPEALRAVRQLLVGGDAMSVDHARRALNLLTDGVVVNCYGPTENTTCTSFYPMAPGRSIEASVPVGYAVSNTQIYILDPDLQPVPIGVPGELYTGGNGLARGYLNRPDLTAAHFVANPFRPGRLYKTGDRARYRADGAIEFLGRLDHQVKINGYRIEPDEIAAVVAHHPAVRDVYIAVGEDAGGNKHLVAYVVPQEPEQMPAHPESSADASALLATLRRDVGRQLPAYMVPTAFVCLADLPLTPHGKIDRRALPPAALSPSLDADPAVLPRTPEETQMATLWGRILGLEQIGVHDHFFELGGHSLQAMQLVSLIASTYAIDLPVQTLFLHPTIASLVSALAACPPRPQAPSDKTTSGSHRRTAGSPGAGLMPPPSPFTTFVRHSLLDAILSGAMAPVDAAALAYLPASLPEQTGVSRDIFLTAWCGHRPRIVSLLETSLGRLALIVLPCWSDRLYDDADKLQALTLEALQLARQVGADTVSLTGLLPSATDYGRTIAAAMGRCQDMPRLSTGHATTTSAVVMTIDKLLHEGDQHLSQACVGFIGLGSIGRTTLGLMLSALPHPQKIMLCDVYQKRQELEAVQRTLSETYGFKGASQIVVAEPGVPAAFYQATLIVGATNVPDLLDVSLMQPGTMIVDDSAPHCFRTDQAVQRLQQRCDVLFSEDDQHHHARRPTR